MQVDIRKYAKNGLCVESLDGRIGTEYITLGLMMRIADATELMATNFLSLQNENERLKKDKEGYRDKFNHEAAAHRTSKGHLTGLRKEIKRLEELTATSNKIITTRKIHKSNGKS